MHHTPSCTFIQGVLSCFKLFISRHRFYCCVWICWTPNPWSCIGVSCNLIAISNASNWVESFCCDSVVLECVVSEATNHVRCCASINVILALWIVLFSLWSKSQGVSPGSIVISLNSMIDCVSDFGLLNSLFNAAWISMIPMFRWSLECLIYHVNTRSYNVLTNVAFLILSSMTPCTSHTELTTNQNWSESSFPTPLNTGILIALAILHCGGGKGGVGGDGGEEGEMGGSVGGGGKSKVCCLIRLTVLLGETFASCSLLSCEGEIKGLFSNSSLLLLL